MSAARPAIIVAGVVLSGVVLALGVPYLSAIVMGDPPPGRDVAPLEFIAVDADDGKCVLNRRDVAAGVHDFSVITEGSGAVVELRDETGKALFRSEDPEGSGVVEGPGSDNALELEKGRHTLVCRYPSGAVGEATLTVTAE